MVVGEQFVEPTHDVIDIWMNCHRLGRRLVGTVGHLFVGIVQTGYSAVANLFTVIQQSASLVSVPDLP